MISASQLCFNLNKPCNLFARVITVTCLRRPVIVGARPVRPKALGPDEDGTVKAIFASGACVYTVATHAAFVGPILRGSSAIAQLKTAVEATASIPHDSIEAMGRA